MACDPILLEAELNLAENAFGRAMRAARKSDFAKVWEDTNTGIGHAQVALAMCHDDAEHEHPEKPAPEPTGDIWASDIMPVPTTIDRSLWLKIDGAHTDGEADKGSFRLTGNVSHLNYDDAIVFPGKPGAAHLHMYWGNTRVDAHSTYESLRGAGNGTTEGGPLLRSAYWMPQPQLTDTGLIPEYIIMYYKRAAKLGDPMPVGVERLARIPRGLRMITRKGKYVLRKPGVAAVDSNNVPLAEILASVAPGDVFQIVLDFPDAWDGLRVDSADHMGHMAHVTERDKNTGQEIMPASHPVLIPHVQEILTFVAQEGEDWTQFHLSSDMGAEPGSTLHGDYFEAQDDEIRDEWHANAIERRLNCSGGDMGGGRGLRRPPSFTFNQQPNRIPLSAVPVGGEYRLIS